MCWFEIRAYNLQGQVVNSVTMRYLLAIIVLIISDVLHEIGCATDVDCSQLRIGQYMCPDPDIDHIDSKTQQPIGCTKNNVAKVWCIAAEDLVCNENEKLQF